jgi:peptide/nickel transport system substrate-binding protein
VGSMLLYFNLQKIREKSVREAVQYAIDREAVVKALYSTYGDSVSYNIPRAMTFFHDTAVPTYGFDPDRARRILDEAGYKPGGDGIRQNSAGQRLVWEMPSSSIASTIAASQMIAGMLRRVGIQANIRIMDFRSYEANAINGNYDVAYYEWAGSSADNPWHNTLVTYSQYAWKIPQINDPVLDRLHVANLTTLDKDTRKRVLREYVTHVQRNAYYVTLGHKPYVFVARPEVEGVGFFGNRLMFNGAWLNR